ncbi:DUF493 family protein YbeD [Candidatus Erwinia haradaeae]|uniref:UPF0250 protein ERCISPPA3004_351 n=1 Tax=Candidatus Erwinia haradaeae TaxID=1922217 RepID=A0A451DMC8_9GAMM|nr:DUF493 family protein YbeD [Candidatus Erwinia haradaeae]VFP87881.1 UPF0250 protein YbeD [Candidatus Erwinia haradaeae]
MKSNLISFLKFPTLFTYKIIALSCPGLVEKIVKVVQMYAPGEYDPELKTSQKGKYSSVSITVAVTHIKQVDTLYDKLGNIEKVLMVL